ncbi:hypothetical protein JL722_12393 [Aureococcus anophagefferens]|nr:hypothetical protein JL722_12393 [Aureococcus anophagefferens]
MRHVDAPLDITPPSRRRFHVQVDDVGPPHALRRQRDARNAPGARRARVGDGQQARAYAAWIEAARARARAADLTASARDGAGLDEAFAAWYMYDKVATDLLWRWDAIAGDGDDGALRASTLANLAAAAAPRGSVTTALRRDEAAHFPAARDPPAAARASEDEYAAQLARAARYAGTRSAALCRPEAWALLCKEPRFYGSPQRVKGYDAYLEDFAPALESPRERADPPLVGDFTACLFYGCDSRDPAATAADILATSRAPPRPPSRAQLARAGCGAEIYAADGGASWRAKGCLARAYRAAGNALVRGFYGDWLEVWLAATDRVYVAQLEALDAAALDALHDFLGLARHAYSDVVLAERLNVAKALRADGATRFEAGPVEAVPDADAAALRELREKRLRGAPAPLLRHGARRERGAPTALREERDLGVAALSVLRADVRGSPLPCEPHQGKDAAQWPPMVEASSPSASTAT